MSRRSRERANASLPADVARCAGVGSDAEGWREGCEDCLRRTCAPTDHPCVAHMDPPKVIVFFCPYHMQPERCPNTGDLFEGDDDADEWRGFASAAEQRKKNLIQFMRSVQRQFLNEGQVSESVAIGVMADCTHNQL